MNQESILPNHLAERICGGETLELQNLCKRRESIGRHVIYWMQTAIRSEDNPALDVAVELSNRSGLPLLVYHGLSQLYDYASDRHHRFILEGARDVQEQFRSLGINYLFFLETSDKSERILIELANDALVVVTESMPTDPARKMRRAFRTAAPSVPLVSVDSACIVPSSLVGKPYTRAFQFREATKTKYAQRLGKPWQSSKLLECPSGNSSIQNLIEKHSVDLQVADLDELIQKCDIDHTIPPIHGTEGGTNAGLSRWNAFLNQKIDRYDKDRNDPLKEASSRMSPYLHYGMVSPFRIANDAFERGTVGATKFLDELLIWRELAFCFCHFRPDHYRWSALPDWAKDTLRNHQSDPRPNLYSMDTLARGCTEDSLWNAAQRSLFLHGELHNNVRMTWGKAVLQWTEDPKTALKRLIDLNHRYALDGRDPSSFGGILWCLGGFDRPFQPEQTVFGSVRTRPTEQHANRLNVNAYAKLTQKSPFGSQQKVAVIGAGLSGSLAARTLRDQGIEVVVFEKSRGVGGRMSTRRRGDASCFDHGAQYFTARHRQFRRHVENWTEAGLVARWPASESPLVVLEKGNIQSKSDSVDRFVGVPGMNAICKYLSSELNIVKQTRIGAIRTRADKTELIDDSGVSLGDFDRVLITAPAEQAAEMLVDHPEMVATLSQVKMNPCYAALVTLSKPVTQHWSGAFLKSSFLSWVSRNGTKPNRLADKEYLVIHASPDWTQQHWEEDPTDVAIQMLSEFWRVSGCIEQTPDEISGHRWKYSIPENPLTERCVVSADQRVFACGDWAGGPRVEGAFLSGMAAVGRLMASLNRTELPKAEKQRQLF